jgi:hypothetical protein
MRFAASATTVFCVGLIVGGSVAPAQPPVPPAPDETLPAPRVAPAEPPVVITGPYLPPVPYRVSAYEVWQHLGTNRQGQWVPRVILMPDGTAYYSYSGKPYPWTTLYSRNLMPYAND